MYPAALRKIPIQTVDSSQVLAKWIRQEQPQLIKSITKNWDRNTIEDLEQVCPKQDHVLLSTFWSSKTILSKNDIISVIRHLVLNAENSWNECYRKNNVELKDLN